MGGRSSGGGNFSNFTTRLANIESSLRKEKSEVGIILDDSGKELSRMTSGDRGEVKISSKDAKLMEGKHFTHNHTDESILSPADIQTTINRGLKSMRAVTPNGVYILEKTGNSINKSFAADYNKALNNYANIYRTQPALWRMKHKFQQATQEYGRDWLKKNAKKYGYSYREE